MFATIVAVVTSLALSAPQAAQAPPAQEPAGAPAAAPPVARAPASAIGPWATEVAAMFQAGNLDGISARFDPRLASLLSPEAFRDGWVGIEEKNGKLQSIGAPVVKNAGPVDIAVMAARFEKVEWTLTLAFDAEARIISIRFTPMSPDAAAKAPPPIEFRAPPYGNPKKFRDSAVKLGDPAWVLPGTISMPAGKGPFPGVVLVHGSGPLDRDETVGGTKVFRDLAWGLASQGIAVLRYDKRTRVHGDKVGSAPATVKDEVIDDAVAAVNALRATPGVDPRRIVVIGHSLGGYLVPRIARADGKLAGVVALAGSTRPVYQLIHDQLDYLVENGAVTEEDVAPMRADADAIKALDPTRPPPAGRVMGAPPGYWLDLRKYDPAALAHENAVPILVLQGGRDYQVTSKDLDGWKRELSGDRFATFRTFPKADHLFVFGEGKSLPSSYPKPGNVAGEVVNVIAKWVKGLKPTG
jgi:dienelactone hydrolase